MIVLHIEAESLDELKGMAFRALGMTLKDKLDMVETPVKRPVGRPKKAPEPEAVVVSVPGLDPDPKPGWVRLGPDRQPEAVEDDEIDIGGMPSPDQHDDYREPVDEPDAVEVAVADVIALEKLKAETMILIQDMFAAGKVKAIRAVLDKHGGGAKSFPEIEAKEFPVISAALKAA